MQNDTKFVLGASAVSLPFLLHGMAKGVARAAQAMNAQIDHDLYTLGATGHLPDTEPVLPLSARPKSKIVILLTSLVLGFLIVAVSTALLGSALVDSSAPTPLLAVLEVIVGATIMGVILGWVPGAVITLIRFQRDNVRRAQAQVIERYADYWIERQQAQAALRAGAVEPVFAAQRLAAHALDIEDEETR